ncbi:lysine-specific histone demethylase 1 homolog 3 [Olea europaea subsp. europaea]|uniref:Lysine-specific histone demethylase 1 homolog 3 n=1 Tax=Olea europaea subsp. europaea TaxID=158383 RepID=A0A8S0PHJ9_OLEEU|nr:lysine-specific histone demethylase 1 homolog 3 [Olea europaea subsp. europaea]
MLKTETLGLKGMQGEENKTMGGSKRKLKPVETAFDSDDDEPILSLLKLKGKRNKKTKSGLDGGGNKGKGIEKMVVEDEELGGMGDTLASFRKKLKGPKKDRGSAAFVGKHLGCNIVDSSCRSSKGSAENVDSDAMLLDVGEKNQVSDIGGSDGDGTVGKACEVKHETTSTRTKFSSVANKDGRESHNGLNNQIYGNNTLRDEKESASADEYLEDSMFTYVQKVQSTMIRKSRGSSRLKQGKEIQTSDDVLISSSIAGSDILPPRVSDGESRSVSKLVNKFQDSDYILHSEPEGDSMQSTLIHQTADDGLPHVSDHLQGNLISNYSKLQELSPSLETNEILRSNDAEDEASLKAISEHSISISVVQRSDSCFRACSGMITSVQDGKINFETNENHSVLAEDEHVSNFIINTGEFPNLNSKDYCLPPFQEPMVGVKHDKVDDLSCDVSKLPAVPKQIEKGQFDEVLPAEDSSDHLDSLSGSVPRSRIPSMDPKISSSDGRVPEFCLDNISFNRECDDASQHTVKSLHYKNLELSTCPAECVRKMGDDVKSDHRINSDLSSEDFRQFPFHLSSSAAYVPQDERRSSSDSLIRIPGKCIEETDIASVSSQEEDGLVSECRSSPVSAPGVHKYVVAFQKHQHEAEKTGDCGLFSQPSHSMSKGAFMKRHKLLSRNEEADRISSPSSLLDLDGICVQDIGSFADPEIKDSGLSVGQRTARKAKKHRHGDMAYEGDADWAILMHGQGFLVSHMVIDSDKPSKAREKFDSASTVVESENGKAAAVLAGLKARAVGPVEKIKFKEVLKRKGGSQEYLDCRNHILSVWNKDISRILPLEDFGVSNTPFMDEHPRTTLIRDIYTFLDQRGCINFGVASEKVKAESNSNHDLKLLKEEKFREKSGGHVADSEDGVSFILGRVKSSKTSTVGKNDNLSDDEKQVGKAKAVGFANLQTRESSIQIVHEICSPDDCRGNGYLDANAKRPEGVVDLDYAGSIPSSEDENGRTLPTVGPDFISSVESDIGGAVPIMHSKSPKVSAQSLSSTGDGLMHCDNEPRKRIIVVGAGPAGLTAARHMQRQGFDVTVLEARSRIGGRVFTDRSSFTVPVDLGASIITGVEADVATERRPDPSSLVCAQLGLELTVLNSDCPLYDTVTGGRVPAHLDEALEAEYNSLLDDMLVLVAEKGEYAMRMSLEEGLEYALKRRRMASSIQNQVDGESNKKLDTLMDSQKFGVDNEVIEAQGSKAEILNPLERRVMDWHFANLEYGCAALLKEVSLPYWNQDDDYGGFGGAHCMIKGGYSAVVESLGEGLCIHLNHIVTNISYFTKDCSSSDELSNKVKISTSNGKEFVGDAVLVTVPLGCLKAETIKFSPPLPQWKYLSIKRLGFGVLNKVVLEFPEVFWDDSIDYFGTTAEDTDHRGRCFMFWNVKKTVGAPVLIALVVGKAAIDGQNMSPSDHVTHALVVLRKIFGEERVLDPVASVVTDWGRDPYSYGAYSYVAVGSSGEDYDILGRPVENCLFFAGEATCKEHPDTVGGAMMSGLREAIRIIDILSTGTDYTAEVESMEAARRRSAGERSELRDIITRLDAVELSSVLCKHSLEGTPILTRCSLLRDMFFTANTTAGRLHLAKELLNLPAGFLKTFTGTKEGLSTLNSWILDSMGKDGTQLLRHCVRLLVLVSTDLLAVRLSGIGKTVKEKVCVHTSRDIRAIASQLVSLWVEIFRKEKASNGRLRLLRQPNTLDSSKSKSFVVSGKPPLFTPNAATDGKGSPKVSVSSGHQYPNSASTKKVCNRPVKAEKRLDSKSEVKLSASNGSVGRQNAMVEENRDIPMTEEERAAFAAAEAAREAAVAAAEAYTSSGAMYNTSLELPKILSFHKFARREQYTHMDESDSRRNWSDGAIGRQDCLSEIDSRNCRVRDWSVDFSAAGVNLDSSKVPVDNHSQRSQSNEIASQLNLKEHSRESVAAESGIFTKAWVDSAGSVKDYNAIERWQCQAAAASSGFSHGTMHVTDEEDSNMSSKLHLSKYDAPANESSASHIIVNKEKKDNQPRGTDRVKQAVVDYVASLLMPLYKARKIDKEGYKSIMKKTATKVMENTTDAEKVMPVFEFLDSKRKNKVGTQLPIR